MERNVFGISDVKESPSRAEITLKKQAEYLNYINTHIANVKKAFAEMCENEYLYSTQNAIVLEALETLKRRIDKHDESKFSDAEFEAYRRHFYPVDVDENKWNEEDFQNAWEHHYTVNSHHPEHFKRPDGTIEDMPLVDILEMIADWESFRYIEKGGAKSYWNSEKSDEVRSAMSEKTKKIVDRIIKLMDD